ncbi:anti-sigma factor antagonist [Rathayibacter sp. VKM Ac-2803]|uniref:STAS domain-containing protein n=1 Tax=unclassified Rathayibacter TaxID=2609250 RepID=UPI00135CC71C|nr:MULTISPECIES: STAS domain-containing protein [unclassified Rathayibacter]MWV50214.1 anti-sigma factor antagonist [Rathayibacter sp. VKM Ac-2803]MWV60743.1 anti-sigma factor antagonist [Rathayibacter sp. VKM Ac-2754]
MQLSTEKIEPDIVVVRPVGRLDLTSVPEFEAVVLRAISDGDLRVVVDLAGVDFLDSSGLGVLVACLKEARRAGGDIRVASPAEQPAMVLRLSNLDRLLGTTESVEDAYRV